MTRILVVEDDPIARDAVSEYLRTFDYTVDTAGNHPEAHRKIRRHRPDLVLLDVHTCPVGARPLVDECRSNALKVADMLSVVTRLSQARSGGRTPELTRSGQPRSRGQG
jgi:CheY-like chemotaxis protein